MKLSIKLLFFASSALLVAIHGAPSVVCTVGPGMPFPDINAALMGNCGRTKGSLIYVKCVKGTCTLPGFDLSAYTEINIRSAEESGGGHVIIKDIKPLVIIGSHGHRIEGLSFYGTNADAVYVEDGSVTIAGVQGGSNPSYGTIYGPEHGMYVMGDSTVKVTGMAMKDCTTGAYVQSTAAGAPVVAMYGVVLQSNGLAMNIQGCPGCGAKGKSPSVLFGFGGVAGFNYVYNNSNGFVVAASSTLQLEHTIMAANLRTGPNPVLFDMQDASSLEIFNVMAYDNDQRPNPASLSTPVERSLPNTGGIIILHQTSGKVNIRSSSFINNENDLVIHYASSSLSGFTEIDHSYFHGNQGKVVSASVYTGSAAGCPKIHVVGATAFDNASLVDPPRCDPGFLSQDLNPQPTVHVADAGPRLLAPSTLTYPIHVFEPFPIASATPFGAGFTVDGFTPDLIDLDVGFHQFEP